MKIKGRLGGSRKKRNDSNANPDDWQKFLKEDEPAAAAAKKAATMFGDATIEAAIAAATEQQQQPPEQLTVDITTQETPPPSDTAELAEEEKLWPGVMAFCTNLEDYEGDTQRLEKKEPKTNKRSRPASRDSLGSYGKLSVVSSIADLTVDKMSLTNSVSTLCKRVSCAPLP